MSNPIRLSFAAAAALVLVVAAAGARGEVLTVEPDDHPAGTVLTNVNPAVRLVTTTPIGPDTFDITSAEGDSAITDLSPTGTRVFAHVGVPFFLDSRKLRAEFDGVTSAVSLAFAGSDTGGDVGRLEAYGTGGQLLAFDETAPLAAGRFETLSVTRPTSDIAYTLAYTSAGSFGRLDALAFERPVPVPEPGGIVTAAAAGAAVGGACLFGRRGRRRRA